MGLDSADGALPRLHVLVSERELDRTGGVEDVLRVMERARPISVHLRARLSARRRFDHAMTLASESRRTGGWLVVNGRPDIALAVGAHAVQLGRAALGVSDTRGLVEAQGGRLAIGASVHAADEAVGAVDAGADYLVLGTIYPTASHPGVHGSGPGAIEEVVSRLSRSPRPVLAIGGIRADRIGAVVRAGAHGVVVGGAVWEAAEPDAAARALRDELDGHAELDGHSEDETHR